MRTEIVCSNVTLVLVFVFFAVASSKPFSASASTEANLPTGVAQRLTGAGTEFVIGDNRTLYTYERDKLGVSTCVNTCMETWQPFVAGKEAQPVGDWAPIARPDDEGLQWAWRGKPVYTYVKDIPGSSFGEGFQVNAWRVAFDPVFMPDGLSIRVGHDGRYLTDWDGRPLYWRADGAECQGDCLVGWIPVSAPQIAEEKNGDWTAVKRLDGTRQWAFRERALYLHDTGVALNEPKLTTSGWQVAVLEASPPLPEWVTVRSTDMGHVFANSEGLTLYKAPDNLDHIHRVICDPECVRDNWSVVVADANASPSGHWSVIEDEGGNDVWAYRGDALYLYKRDKAPGDYGGDEWAKGLFGPGWTPVMATQSVMPEL